MRLRAALWGHPPYALLLTGRSEHLEKYGCVVARLADRGFGTVSFDWRGQGLSDRLIARNLGYVRNYSDYQLDIAASLDALEVRGAQIPVALTHSMGGLIVLRYLRAHRHLRAAILSGPLLGLKRQTPVDPLLHLIVRAGAALGFGARLLPGSTMEPTVIATPFQGNPLTRSQARWDQFHSQIATVPALGVGGITLSWLAATLREMRAADGWPAPEIPTLLLMGLSEDVVSVPALRRFAARGANVTLAEFPDAEHEVLMEGPKVEAATWARIDAFLASANIT